MRIVLIGQAPFGAQVLEQLVKKGEDVVGAFAPVGKRGERVKEAAEKFSVPVYQVESMKSESVRREFSLLKPDLGVMAFVTDIVPLEILSYPRLGTIQYHPSLLPKHRGGSAINWAIIQGDARTGITIFWPDKGIDTGPILMQKEVDIAPDDTVGSLYFNKLFPLGVTALVEAVDQVRQGTASRIPQDESRATYEGLCGEEQAIIDWSQPAQKTHNLIRGTNPQPGAYTYLHGKKLKIFESQLALHPSGGKPGEVLEISDSGIKVAAGDGIIIVKQVQPESASKIESAKYAESIGLKKGVILGL